MGYDIIELDEAQIEDVDERLGAYDESFFGGMPEAEINLGVLHDGELVAGICAAMSEYNIMDIKALFVDEGYRGRGLGRFLVRAMEESAIEAGANVVRVDSDTGFGWKLYPAIGYREMGQYTYSNGDANHLFVKIIGKDAVETHSEGTQSLPSAFQLAEMDEEQAADIKDRLDNYEAEYFDAELEESEICLGIMQDDKVVGGAWAFVWSGLDNVKQQHHAESYLATLFVDENYRGKGLGAALMRELEKRARSMGVQHIRVDTFDWQNPGFYRKLGYEEIGHYTYPTGYAEYFFVKHL